MYVVIKAFTDLHDNNYAYKVGDTFPRLGVEVSDKRISELAGANNKQHTPLIKPMEDDSMKAQIGKSLRTKKGSEDNARDS